MNCPKCNALMQRVDFEHLVGNDIWEAWQCSVCGYRKEVKKERRVFRG